MHARVSSPHLFSKHLRIVVCREREREKEGERNVVSFQKIHEVKQEKKRERISSPQRAFFLLATTIAEMPGNVIPKFALLIHLHFLPFSVR
jgi:hypothetical protein